MENKGSFDCLVSVIIPTYNAGEGLVDLIRAIRYEAIQAKVIVVDSHSKDRTMEAGRRYADYAVLIEGQFNHGATREWARKIAGGDIVIFLTQDIIPCKDFLKKLVAPLVAGDAALAYSRQIPHDRAGILEAFPREYNYPSISLNKNRDSIKEYGVWALHCSDSCAAYRQEKLDEIGGFKYTLTNEDYIAAAKLVRAGYSIAYVAESVVKHSHSYTLKEEFQRSFDNGYIRGINGWIGEMVGAAEGRGVKMTAALLSRLARSQFWLLPYAILQAGAKWLGFRFGYHAQWLPRSVCRVCSSQKPFWR